MQVLDCFLNRKMSSLCRVKPFLSHTAFGKSQDRSSLLRSALANERAKANNWGNNDLMKCFLCLAITASLALSVCNHLVPSSFQFLSTGMAAHSRSCTSKHISFNMTSDVCMWHTILQSWLRHQNSSAAYMTVVSQDCEHLDFMIPSF